MMRQTGGTAVGAISTRSSSASSAILFALARLTTPTCSPAAPIRRTSDAVISPLIRASFSCAMRAYSPVSLLLRRASLLRFLVFQTGNEVLHRHAAEVFSLPGTDGNLGSCLFLVTDHDLVGQLLQTMFSNFIGNFVPSQVGDRP